jgi:hypothetical protein
MGPLWSIAPAVRLCTHLGVAIADARRPAPANFNVPGADPAVVVGVGAPETWEALNKALPGSGVATTTTLLAAIWHEAHFVFDWRVRATAAALRMLAGLNTGNVVPDSTSSSPLSFSDYQNVRVWPLDTAASEDGRVADVERALYCLSQKFAASKTPGWTPQGTPDRSICTAGPGGCRRTDAPIGDASPAGELRLRGGQSVGEGQLERGAVRAQQVVELGLVVPLAFL